MPLAWDLGDGEQRGSEGDTLTYTYELAIGAPFTVRATEDEGATWVTTAAPVTVPAFAVDWADIVAATGDGGNGHGSGIGGTKVGLVYGATQPALFEWLPVGTAKVDIECSDASVPIPGFLPLPTAGMEGQRLFFALNDMGDALQVGAPRDVTFHVIGLDGSDVEVWRKSAPFHVDLASAGTRAEPEAFDPGEFTIAQVIDHLDAHPEQLAAVTEAEEAGKARVTLLDELEARRGE
jgi:hypothetical protein